MVDTAAPVIAGMRLRAGRTGSGKGAGRMVAQAITTARAVGVSGSLLVRGDAAYRTLPAFTILTTPTPLHRRACELLGIRRHGMA